MVGYRQGFLKKTEADRLLFDLSASVFLNLCSVVCTFRQERVCLFNTIPLFLRNLQNQKPVVAE